MNTKQKALVSPQNPSYDVDEFIDRLKEFLDKQHDSELSEHFGFTKNQIATFRRRDTISSAGMQSILDKLGGRINFNWALFGIGTPTLETEGEVRQQYKQALGTILERLGFSAASPEARTIINTFVEIADEALADLPAPVVQAKINGFIGDLMKYMLVNSPKNPNS